LVYSQDSNFLAIGRYDRVEIWRLSDKTLFRTLTGIGFLIDQVKFSPNGNIFATGLTTAQWSGIDGKLLQSLRVRGRTFSPDTKLVVGIQSNKLHYFRMSDGKLIKTLRLNFFVQDVVLSADGKLMALAGHDGTISIWGISPQ
jgi:WD40 repeat protein